MYNLSAKRDCKFTYFLVLKQKNHLKMKWLKFYLLNFIYGFQKDQTVPLKTANCLLKVSYTIIPGAGLIILR